jgi:hypothetical protein
MQLATLLDSMRFCLARRPDEAELKLNCKPDQDTRRKNKTIAMDLEVLGEKPGTDGKLTARVVGGAAQTWQGERAESKGREAGHESQG